MFEYWKPYNEPAYATECSCKACCGHYSYCLRTPVFYDTKLYYQFDHWTTPVDVRSADLTPISQTVSSLSVPWIQQLHYHHLLLLRCVNHFLDLGMTLHVKTVRLVQPYTHTASVNVNKLLTLCCVEALANMTNITNTTPLKIKQFLWSVYLKWVL